MFEALLSSFRARFSKNTKYEFADTRVGDFVEIVFHDPRTIGLVDPSGVLTKRYDPEDLQTRMLLGIVTRSFVDHGLRFVELTVTKIVNGSPRTRLYTLMEDDIASIRKLNGKSK